MRIVLISSDKEVIELIEGIASEGHDKIIVFDSPIDPCETLTEIISLNPSLVVFDNDLNEDHMMFR